MNPFKSWVLAILLLVVMIVLLIFIFFVPRPEEAGTVATSTATSTRPTTTTTGPKEEPLSKKVTVTSPKPNATVGKTFTVAGTAPGPWFFEASFPIQVRGADNQILATTPAQAQGEWMTTELVTFTANIAISGSYTGPATLILLKDNPSGMPENDDSVSFPITIQ